MTDESQSIVPPDESVLRRIHRNYYRADALRPINMAAFRPNRENDADGLSFFRESLIDAKSVAESARKPAEDYVVARLSVAHLNRLGLTVIESEIPDLPGHCHIPELAASIYYQDKASKNRCKAILEKLTAHASKDIVYR